jgi:hypothetical protein
MHMLFDSHAVLLFEREVWFYSLGCIGFSTVAPILLVGRMPEDSTSKASKCVKLCVYLNLGINLVKTE